MKVDIGISINYQKLIESKLLAVANSGGGKSWLIRKLMEELFGKVQIIMLDSEGEFYTLREKYDFILFGNNEGSDYSVDIRYAEKMASTLLELGVSAIVDLYEIPPHQRITFVKRFLDASLNAPKNLWHPCIYVIDEAHIYAPETGSAESLQSMNNFLSRGRKRGFCPVITTQRFSKLNKDTAAECNNMLIGRCAQDIDRKRAAEQLGFTTKDQILSLRELEPGEFYGFGPAIGDKYEITKFKVGSVKTTHIKAGAGNFIPTPPPTERLKKILEKVTEIPREAEKERKDYEDLRRENIGLKTKLTQLEKIGKYEVRSTKDEKIIEQLRIENGELKIEIKKGYEKDKNLISKIKSIQSILKVAQPKIIESLQKLFTDLELFGAAEIEIKEPYKYEIKFLDKNDREIKPKTIYKPTGEFREVDYKDFKINTVSRNQTLPVLKPRSEIILMDGNLQLGKCAFEIIKFLAVRPDKIFTKTQIGAMIGYAPNGGGFNNSISELNTKGLIEKNGSSIKLSMAGVEYLNMHNISPGEGEFSPRIWLEKLPVASKKIFEVLLENPEAEYLKEELGEITGYAGGGGGFGNAVSKLCTLGLAERINGRIRLNKEINHLN